MTAPAEQTVHGAAVALKGTAVLLRGPSRAGKSDLALRLIDAGGVLIGDDQIVLTRRHDKIIAAPPQLARGLLEIRGVGLAAFPVAGATELAFVFDLTAKVPRLPDWGQEMFFDLAVPCLALNPFESSAVAKLHAALALARDPSRCIR